MYLCVDCGSNRTFVSTEEETRVHVACKICAANFWIEKNSPEELLADGRKTVAEVERDLTRLSSEIEEADDEDSDDWLADFFEMTEAHLREAARKETK